MNKFLAATLLAICTLANAQFPSVPTPPMPSVPGYSDNTSNSSKQGWGNQPVTVINQDGSTTTGVLMDRRQPGTINGGVFFMPTK